jgi:hypothetical protein
MVVATRQGATKRVSETLHSVILLLLGSTFYWDCTPGVVGWLNDLLDKGISYVMVRAQVAQADFTALGAFASISVLIEAGHISWRRNLGFSAFVVISGAVAIAMSVTSFAVPGQVG